MADETEIKFVVKNVVTLERKLRDCGFRMQTPSTHEVNTLYDLPDGQLRARGEVLRIRRYGQDWKLTHKTKGTAQRHKVREELETQLVDGPQMDAIFRALGYAPSFVYEKFRSEWTDGRGEVVVDRTPIGDIAEIEGAPEWIDRVAAQLGVTEQEYITKSYAILFLEWRERTGSKASNMTFDECGKPAPQV